MKTLMIGIFSVLIGLVAPHANSTRLGGQQRSNPPTQDQRANTPGADQFLLDRVELHPYVRMYGWRKALRLYPVPCDQNGAYVVDVQQSTTNRSRGHVRSTHATVDGRVDRPREDIRSTHYCRDYMAENGAARGTYWRIAYSRTGSDKRIFRIDDNQLALAVEFNPQNTIVVDNTGISSPDNNDQQMAVTDPSRKAAEELGKALGNMIFKRGR